MKKNFLGLLFIFLSQSLQARYYDPDMGRFASRDPLQYIDGMNLYVGYFAQRFQLDPMGTEFSFPKVNKKDIQKSIDEYNKVIKDNKDFKPQNYPIKEDIERNQKKIDEFKKYIESVLAGKEGSNELQKFIKCLNDSKLKITIDVDLTYHIGKKGDKNYPEFHGALTRGKGIVDNNEIVIDFNFNADKKASNYTLIHELLHVVEFSIVYEEKYEEKYDRKALDCPCINTIKALTGKKHKWKILSTMHQNMGGGVSRADLIQKKYFKMKGDE